MYFNNVTKGFKDNNGCLPEPDQLQVPLWALLFDAEGSEHPLHCVLLSASRPHYFFCYAIKIPAEN